jgi:hypothetical protein
MRGAGVPSPLMEPRKVRRFDWVPADLGFQVRLLFGRSFRHRVNRYKDAALGFGAELDPAGD